MAANSEDSVHLLNGYDGQVPPIAITKQLRLSSLPPMRDISSLTTVVNALRSNKHIKSCLCFHWPVVGAPYYSSALLIGTTQLNGKKDENLLSTNGHIVKMKNHLSKLQVDIFQCDPNYKDSQASLDTLISNFLSQRGVSNFYLYYSGPTNERGDWSISSEVYGEQREDYIRLDTITQKWKKQTPAGRQLVIIVDAENSHKWVEKIKEYEQDSDIAILTPPSPTGEIGAEIPFYRGQYTLNLVEGLGQAFVPAPSRRKISQYVTYT